MPLKNKYLRYTPEITLEIFTLVCNKLIECGINLSHGESIATKYNNFSKIENYLQLNGTKSCFECYREDYGLTETTVQEILGYDPFVKEDFVLPEKWCLKTTDETRSIVEQFICNNGYYSKLTQNFLVHFPFVSSGGSAFNSIQHGYKEITFEQFQKYVLKTTEQPKVIETKVESKEIIPEYVECISVVTCNTKVGEIFKCRLNEDNFEWEYNNKSIPDYDSWDGWSEKWGSKNSLRCFKPSTKEAFDAQNKPKSIEKWSVGSYVVFLKDNLQSNGYKRGQISTIRQVRGSSIDFQSGCGNDISGSFSVVDNLKWFATKSEAEEFAKTLVEPVKEEVKQPLKQAVHCTTQEEWDFVCEKLHRKSYCKFREIGDSIFISNPECSYFKDNNPSDIGFMSFQEWCDLNGYKMEPKCDFIVGKWYKMNDCWYLKYKGKDIVDTDEIYMSECIDSTFNHKYDNGFVAYLHEQKTWRLASIEEIQQYLPDGHSDKINVNQEFKVGEYIFVMIKKHYGDILKITSIRNDEKQSGTKGTVWIKHTGFSFSGGGFRLGSAYKYNEHVRHATPEEINNHLISIGQIPTGEPLNCGIEPNKDGMFKYTTGNSYNKEFSTSVIPVKKPKMILSINNEELPMVNIIKTNSIKQLLNLD